MKVVGRHSGFGWLLGSLLLSGLFSAQAQALTENITALFKPDPNNPMVNKFTNTTPQSAMCLMHAPAGACDRLGIFSLRIPYTVASTGPIVANHADPRKGVMFRMPSDWRSVMVTHESGRTETVEFRIAAIGGRWNVPRPPGVSAWMQPGLNWDRPWRSAVSPCQPTGAFAAGVTFALFFWYVPEGAGMCALKPSMTLDWLSYSMLEYAYEIRTPRPLGMASGKYTGTFSYTMGPGMDLDFGDLLVPPDNSLVFNVMLDVQHELKVEVPPGGNRVELVPDGGWQQWLNRGRRPSRLFRDQTVNVFASSQFKMNLECSLPMGNTCGMRNSSGHQVPVDVAVTLPHGLSDAAGRPVSRQPLRLDGVGTEMFQPSFYVDRKPSTLHFEVKADAVAQMLEQDDGDYSGLVTVVWDSEV